jgi:transcriptional regulator with AAA-type ATPase domain
MLLHLMIVDDQESVLEALTPGFVGDLGKRLTADPGFQQANAAAGSPFPSTGRINARVSAVNYQSRKVPGLAVRSPVHVHLHLVCEKGGSFRHALRLLKEQLFAVVVSDLRFSEDASGARAGRYFIEDVQRRNPESYGVLYSAYQKPDGFPPERFVRKGASSNLAGEELVAKMVEGATHFLNQPAIRRLGQEITQRGLLYQSDAFGSVLRRIYDHAALHFGAESPDPSPRRRPRPTLLLNGETGTGKTEIAHLVHALSERRSAPFQSANCNQLTNETFLRSALFGHVKGAFSGANADRPGLVQAAGKGVLLLDDLHAIDEDCSVILHSFLDDGEYSHLGEDEVRRQAHAAIIATVETPRWAEIVAERKLPESFINRVEQLVVRIPPLRERSDDIIVQSAAYCRDFAEQLGAEMELSSAALDWLVEFGFPSGNSRKLRDFIKGVVTENAKTTDVIDVDELVEFSSALGLTVPDGDRRKVSSAVHATESPAPASNASHPWPAGDSDPTQWSARIVRLATKAIEEDVGVAPADAESICRVLFEDRFPSLWTSFETIVRSAGSGKTMDVKLFDELLRYYVVFVYGNPAKAARELGMKDNALREFIYSREQRRIPNPD